MTAVPYDTSASNDSSSFSVTIGASATVAVAFTRTDGTGMGVTVNSVSMTRVITDFTANGINWDAFYMVNPSTGTQTVARSGTGITFCTVHFMTYTGGPYASSPDCTGTGSKAGGSGTTLNIPLVTTTNNVIGTSAASNGGVAFLQASGMTFRSSTSVANRCEDSTNLIATPQTFNMAWDNNGNTTDIGGVAVGIGLAAAAVMGGTRTLLGVGS